LIVSSAVYWPEESFKITLMCQLFWQKVTRCAFNYNCHTS